MSGVGSAEDTSSPYHLRYLDQKAYTELKDKGVTSEEDIFSLSATVIAQQLCLMDFDEFNTIQPREFCNKGIYCITTHHPFVYPLKNTLLRTRSSPINHPVNNSESTLDDPVALG